MRSCIIVVTEPSLFLERDKSTVRSTSVGLIWDRGTRRNVPDADDGELSL